MFISFLWSTVVVVSTWNEKENKTLCAILKSYVSKVLATYSPHSLIIASNDFNSNKNLITSFYELSTPIYSLDLEGVSKFNGAYHGKYDERITFEESKIYVVILDNIFEMELLLPKLQSIYFWRQRDQILIVILETFTPEITGKLKALYAMYWKSKILNLTVAFFGNTITTATYNPFDNTIFFLRDSHIFPDKLKNLNGYHLNISMFSNILDAIPDGKAFKGRDGLTASTVEQILNATFTYIGPNDSADYGENLGRMRMTGVFADVASGRTAIAFNSRYLKGEFENLLEATYPHGRDDLTGLVPVVRPSDIKDFGRNFSPQIWLLVIGTQLVLLCLICILTAVTLYRVEPVVVAGVLYRTMLGQPEQYCQDIVSVRMVLLSVTYIAFFFEIAYVSQLASILAVPRKPHQINTLEDLANSDLKIYTLVRFKKMLNRTLREPLRQKLLPKLLTYQENEQIDELNEHKYVGAVCKEHIAMYVVKQKNNYVGDGMFYRIMDEKPMPSIVCYGVGYGSPLLEKLNIIINRLTAAGIPNQWRKLTLEEMSIKGKMYQNMESSDNRTLTLRNLTHVFYCLLLGWCLSLAVFLLEVMVSK